MNLHRYAKCLYILSRVTLDQLAFPFQSIPGKNIFFLRKALSGISWERRWLKIGLSFTADFGALIKYANVDDAAAFFSKPFLHAKIINAAVLWIGSLFLLLSKKLNLVLLNFKQSAGKYKSLSLIYMVGKRCTWSDPTMFTEIRCKKVGQLVRMLPVR